MIKCALVSNTDWYLYNFRLSLARELRENDYEVSLISPAGNYADKILQQGFQWFEWQVGRQSIAPWKEIPAVLALIDLYRGLELDLVHHHTIKPVIYGGLAAERTHVPSVVASITGRGYAFSGPGMRPRVIQKILKPIYRQVLKRENTQIIFENTSDRDFFLASGIAKSTQSHLIESVGVNPAEFPYVPEHGEPVVVLLASRMLWDKGIGVLVDAVRILSEKGISFKVELVGDIDQGNPTSIPKEQIHEWEAENLLDWLGWQTDMQQVYANCHIVVLPSFHEGVPTGLLEAAASGRPIVASDIPGCQSVVLDGMTGFLVPPRQPEPLADALERLIMDPGLRGRMGKAGREHVEKHFTQKLVNQRTMEVYQLAQSN